MNAHKNLTHGVMDSIARMSDGRLPQPMIPGRRLVAYAYATLAVATLVVLMVIGP